MAERGMRRRDKEIVDREELHRILDGDRPYVVPLNFAREGDDLWLHSATAGRKLDCPLATPAVCVETDRLIKLQTGTSACDGWTSHYESVIGFGTAEIVDDEATTPVS